MRLKTYLIKRKIRCNNPDLYFFIPLHLISISKNEIKVLKGSATILDEIWASNFIKKDNFPKIDIQSKLTKQVYIETIQRIQQHIKRGRYL